MTRQLALVAPLLALAMLVPALAQAGDPGDAAEAAPIEVEPIEFGPEIELGDPGNEPVAPAPAIDTSVDSMDYEPEALAVPYEDPSNYEPYEEPEPKRTTLELQSGYIGFGIAPGMTIHSKGFHPNTRFELEFGGTLEHDYRDLGLSFGVATHITPYYERKKPSFGADVTSTTMLGPVYIRTGLGAVGGLPRGHLLHATAAGIGGVIGVGLNFGRQPMIRVGVDYDFRVTTKLEPVHTVFLSVRIACCRDD